MRFRSDLKKMEELGLLKLFTAFSRDQDDKMYFCKGSFCSAENNFKIIFRYVQHRIKEQSVFLRELIKSQNGWILVAGNSKNMPQSVRDAFTDVLDSDSNYIENMIKTGRYQEETWA